MPRHLGALDGVANRRFRCSADRRARMDKAASLRKRKAVHNLLAFQRHSATGY
jgi:hypothetical protein